MPRMKIQPKDQVSYRRTITLTPGVARKIEELAKQEQRTTASMMRILIERQLATSGK